MRDRTRGSRVRAPFYTRVAAASTLVFAASLLVAGAAPAVRGNFAPLAFTAPFAIVSLALAGLAWKRGRWAALLLAAWAAVNLVFHFPILLHALGWLDSFFDFGVVVPVFAGLAVAGVSATVSFVQQRRDVARTESTARERWAWGAVAALVVALMAASGVAHLVGIESVGADERAGAVRLEMKGTRFEPVDLRAEAGQPVRLAIKNRDLIAHRFVVEPLGVDVGLIPGAERIVELPAMDTGTYIYICTVDGHEQMTGFILVR